MPLYIGLMSGTSLDAIDASIVDISDEKIELKHSLNFPIPAKLRRQLLTLLSDNGNDTIDLLGEVDAEMGLLFALAVNKLLKESPYTADVIVAIGSHGQTIRHRPNNKTPFTLQIGDASRISENTGITTVADFRRKDIAAGGQGAPLVPAFHREIFGSTTENRCIINIGGMANISYLPKHKNDKTSGFDTGPGNTLLDLWCNKKTGSSFDRDGEWAKTGEVSYPLLNSMLKEPYFTKPYPKSTGREQFNMDWLGSHLINKTITNQDIQASLTELTAKTIVDAIYLYYPETERIILCGGGVHNKLLKKRINQLSSGIPLDDTKKYGISPDWVEAAAFAWLAYACLNNIPANEPAVTGANSRVILGAIYPG